MITWTIELTAALAKKKKKNAGDALLSHRIPLQYHRR
jgi:hypothetical protein